MNLEQIDASTTELLTCPFCGGSAEFVPYKSDGLTLKCTALGCVQRNQRTLRYGIDSLRASMTKHWNTRAPQWLPIESAPRDGSWIILGRAGHGALLLAFWHRLHSAWRGQGGDDGQWKTWQQATHWQPLPAPPEVQP